MADAKSYLEKNIEDADLSLEEDDEVIGKINKIISEFGISVSNPINLKDGQSIVLTQKNEKGELITEEIFLPSDKFTNFFSNVDRPTAEVTKQNLITFVLENVNARSLSALKNKLSPAPQETETEIDDPLGLLEP